jgi:hypothetical protein
VEKALPPISSRPFCSPDHDEPPDYLPPTGDLDEHRYSAKENRTQDNVW